MNRFKHLLYVVASPNSLFALSSSSISGALNMQQQINILLKFIRTYQLCKVYVMQHKHRFLSSLWKDIIHCIALPFTVKGIDFQINELEILEVKWLGSKATDWKRLLIVIQSFWLFYITWNCVMLNWALWFLFTSKQAPNQHTKIFKQIPFHSHWRCFN